MSTPDRSDRASAGGDAVPPASEPPGPPGSADSEAPGGSSAGEESPEGDRLREDADARLAEALEERTVHDPRQVCRDHLRQLKRASAERYQEAVEYYETELLPGVASGRSDPVAAWVEYAGRLAALRAAGRRVSVDRAGVADSPEEGEEADPASTLVLHLPDPASGGGGGSALVVAMPAEMSPAQRATYDLLVAGKKQWEGPDPEDLPSESEERPEEV